MSKSNPMPDGLPLVIPMLVCRDAAAEIDSCKRTFSADELTRRAVTGGFVIHALLRIGGSMLMIHGEFPNLASRGPQMDGSSPVVLYLQVEEVDAVVPPQNQSWGDRVARIVDPAGHVWNISTRIEDPPPAR